MVVGQVMAEGGGHEAGPGRRQELPVEISIEQRLEAAQTTIQLTKDMIQNLEAPVSVRKSLHHEMLGDLESHRAFLASAVEASN